MTCNSYDANLELFLQQKALELFPIPRNLTGNGVRHTLNLLKELLPNLEIYEIPSGSKAGEWTVPKEWLLHYASIKNDTGEELLSLSKGNLQVSQNSQSFSGILTKMELKEFVTVFEPLPDAIPYTTSYYGNSWGLNMSANSWEMLDDESNYKITIETEFFNGSMTLGELYIPGESKLEVIFHTYTCHPSLANDNLTGILASLAIALEVNRKSQRKFSYRFLFLPETIGSLYIVQTRLHQLKENFLAGWVLTCLGGRSQISFMPSKGGSSLSDNILKSMLRKNTKDFVEHSFLDRGSDERQYCWPGVDLPFSSIFRDKYGTYLEYHTSFDNLSYISIANLAESIRVYLNVISKLEEYPVVVSQTLGEPFLSKYGAYPLKSTIDTVFRVKDLVNILIFCDGQNNALTISERLQIPLERVEEILKFALSNSLVKFLY